MAEGQHGCAGPRRQGWPSRGRECVRADRPRRRASGSAPQAAPRPIEGQPSGRGPVPVRWPSASRLALGWGGWLSS